MIPGVEFVELPEAGTTAAGLAGSQLITHYQTSARVLGAIDHVGATRAEFVASGCPGCQMQLNAGVRRRGLAVQVIHPVELLDRGYEQVKMLDKKIVEQLEQIAGKDGVLQSPEDMAVYSYDGTFEENLPGCGSLATHDRSGMPGCTGCP